MTPEEHASELVRIVQYGESGQARNLPDGHPVVGRVHIYIGDRDVYDDSNGQGVMEYGEELRAAATKAFRAAVAAEREACAQIAQETMHGYVWVNERVQDWEHVPRTARCIADAIRARSEATP